MLNRAFFGYLISLCGRIDIYFFCAARLLFLPFPFLSLTPSLALPDRGPVLRLALQPRLFQA